MDVISGMTDVLRGVNDPGARSATQVAALREQAHSVHYPTFVAIESGEERLFQQVLLLAKKFYIVPRILKCCGDDMQEEAMLFSGSDLEGCVDIKATAGTGVPKSKQIRLSQMLEMQQIIDPMRLRDFTEYALFEEENEAKRREENLIRQEHGILLQGGQLPAAGNHTHWRHLYHHNLIRNSPEWLTFPQMVRDAFEMHCQMHEEFIRPQYADLTGDQFAQPQTMVNALRPTGQPPGGRG
jgi:hypothetical protein